MSEKKIRILMQPSDLQGVGHFRTIWPAQSMQEFHNEDFDVEIGVDTNFEDINYLSQFDIIHFHRQMGDYAKFPELSRQLREKGVIVIMDLDDYWEPPITHPLYHIVKQEKLTEKIISNLQNVDCVTTTTDIFKSYLLKNNPNVHVIPNALDMSHKMWKSEVQENKSGKCRISWIGGSSHFHDLLLLKESMIKLNSTQDLEDKYQIIMCGFDIRGTITEVSPNGQNNVRSIRPEESVWNNFERIFTSDYSLIKNKEYEEYLKKIKRDDFPGFELENYIRRWTLPLTQYGRHYDYCDVCLAPIQEEEMAKTDKGTMFKRIHMFNVVKSELKIIEAGMKKKALIAQDFGIYKQLLKDGETGILVSDNKKGWYKAMRELILNPELRQKLADNLHEYVKDKYELKTVTKERVAFYKQIIKDKADGVLDEFSKQRIEMYNKINTELEVKDIPVPLSVFSTKPKSIPMVSVEQARAIEGVLQKFAKKAVHKTH